MSATTYLSPFDAAAAVEFDLPDCKSARVKRFGIGFGQRGHWGNIHYATQEEAEKAFEEQLIDLRRVYGTPARNWTGKYIEEEGEPSPDSSLLRSIRFVPLKRNGKPGVTIHRVQIYQIDVTPERIAQLADALRIPVR